MNHRCRSPHGFTLIELLLVVAILGILSALVLPNANSTVPEQLNGAAHALVSDLAWARSLAVDYESKYRVTFNVTTNSYTLEHTGANTALDTLPRLPTQALGDAADEYVVRLDEAPTLGASTARLLAAGTGGSLATTTAAVEFGSLGETTSSAETLIWLTAGSNSARRYLAVRVDPITGLAWIGTLTTTLPTGVTNPDAGTGT